MATGTDSVNTTCRTPGFPGRGCRSDNAPGQPDRVEQEIERCALTLLAYSNPHHPILRAWVYRIINDLSETRYLVRYFREEAWSEDYARSFPELHSVPQSEPVEVKTLDQWREQAALEGWFFPSDDPQEDRWIESLEDQILNHTATQRYWSYDQNVDGSFVLTRGEPLTQGVRYEWAAEDEAIYRLANGVIHYRREGEPQGDVTFPIQGLGSVLTNVTTSLAAKVVEYHRQRMEAEAYLRFNGPMDDLPYETKQEMGSSRKQKNVP